MAEMHRERRVPYRGAGGWGFAALITLLGIACYVGAWWVNKQSYCPPLEPACHASAPVYGDGEGH